MDDNSFHPMVKSGLQQNGLLQKLLPQKYNCEALDEASAFFNNIHHRNVLFWNARIRAYTQRGLAKETVQLFDQMQEEGVIPDKVTFACVLSAFTGPTALAEGKRVHARTMCGKFESNTIVRTALASMYGKCYSLNDALKIFENTPEKDVVAWNAMMTAHVQNGNAKEALELFQQMLQQGVLPSRVSRIAITEACAIHAILTQGKQIHACLVDCEHDGDITMWNAIINMYGKCGSCNNALSLFEKMAKRDVISWNTLIAVYAQLNHFQKALQLFDLMQQEGFMADKFTFVSLLSVCASQSSVHEGKKMHARILYSGFEPDVTVGTALLSMYGKCGNVEDAQSVFNKMPQQNVASWNAIIGVHTQHNFGKEALNLFRQMQKEGVQPDKVTLVNTLSACASEAALDEGKGTHACIIMRGVQSNVVVMTALVNMYGKCGRLEDAQMIFYQIPKHNVVSWNAMMAVCAQHGQGKLMLKLFYQMQEEGLTPDELTFISFLSCCSHSGLVDEGLLAFASMNHAYGITPVMAHYVCVIDLLGRAGQLVEAEQLINNILVWSNIESFTALLGACTGKANVERHHVSMQMLDLDSERPSLCIMLLNTYADVGKGNEAELSRWGIMA